MGRDDQTQLDQGLGGQELTPTRINPKDYGNAVQADQGIKICLTEDRINSESSSKPRSSSGQVVRTSC